MRFEIFKGLLDDLCVHGSSSNRIKKTVLRDTTVLALKMIIHPFAFKSMSLVSIFVVVFAKMKSQENFRALIEREIFHWKPYGFARLDLPHISETIVAEIETSSKDIEVSEIQRRVAPGEKERYFP